MTCRGQTPDWRGVAGVGGQRSATETAAMTDALGGEAAADWTALGARCALDLLLPEASKARCRSAALAGWCPAATDRRPPWLGHTPAWLSEAWRRKLATVNWDPGLYPWRRAVAPGLLMPAQRQRRYAPPRHSGCRQRRAVAASPPIELGRRHRACSSASCSWLLTWSIRFASCCWLDRGSAFTTSHLLGLAARLGDIRVGHLREIVLRLGLPLFFCGGIAPILATRGVLSFSPRGISASKAPSILFRPTAAAGQNNESRPPLRVPNRSQ